MTDALLRRGLLPDFLVRIGIRRLLARRLREISASDGAEEKARLEAFAAGLRLMPVAIRTEDSKAQHYEVPTAFYQRVLGPRLKYSCCWFENGDEALGAAEEAMLEKYAERAGLLDGQDVLELGCGWGSLCLWLARRHPGSRITGVSHSRTQKAFIDGEARRIGLRNLTIVTADMNDFESAPERFDRVVSIEMFEHMKNWPLLLSRVSGWLRPQGRLFLHVFSHVRHPYHFEVRDASDWMSRYFFSGGMMPSDTLLPLFQDDLELTGHWTVEGRHYQRTAELWLQNMDRARPELAPVFASTYGKDADLWWAYWRVFFMACAELWGFRNGTEWIVSHYSMEKRRG
jgi:cyclopropane-fatty-acyl-phospholipid synthase